MEGVRGGLRPLFVVGLASSEERLPRLVSDFSGLLEVPGVLRIADIADLEYSFSEIPVRFEETVLILRHLRVHEYENLGDFHLAVDQVCDGFLLLLQVHPVIHLDALASESLKMVRS